MRSTARDEKRALVSEAGKAVEVLKSVAAKVANLDLGEDLRWWSGELYAYGRDFRHCLRQEMEARDAK